jgi:eukaryotic-like serine/threonine-protein kinase
LTAPTAAIGGTTEVLPDEATRVASVRPTAPAGPPAYPPAYTYDERPPKRRRWAPWLLVLLLLAAAGFAGWYVFTQIQDQLAASQPVSVPNVVGIREELAITKLEEAGFVVNTERDASRDVKEGFVMDQRPDGGSRLPEGDEVTIIVSTGVPKTTVPDVVGMDYADAVDTLSDVNLDVRKREVFSKKREGRVLTQDPPSGEVVDEGTTVVLEVSKGLETVAVPDVLNQTEASARSELDAAGFAVEVIEAASDTTPEGFVSAQSPDPGTDAAKGSTVTITVSTGPSTVEVPNVVGQQSEAAEDDLQNAGFEVNVETVTVTDPTQDNVVQDQDPDAGSQAASGSIVTIFVGEF